MVRYPQEQMRRIAYTKLTQAQIDDKLAAVDGPESASPLHCRAELADPIEPSCTLVEMARAQGEGVVRRVEERVLESFCIKRDGRWRIVRAILAAR